MRNNRMATGPRIAAALASVLSLIAILACSTTPSTTTTGTPTTGTLNATTPPPLAMPLPDLFASPINRNSAFSGEGSSSSVEDVLEMGLALAGFSPAHVAIHGDATDSVRCQWRRVARTPKQREEAVRFWLQLASDDALPSAEEVERLLMAALEQISPIYPAPSR